LLWNGFKYFRYLIPEFEGYHYYLFIAFILSCYFNCFLQALHTHFLQVCWNLVVYGSAFFTGSVQVKNIRTPVQVHIGVNDIGLHLIKMENKTIMQTYRYSQIEWVLGQDKLEIRFKETANGTVPRNSQIRIMTKQAGLIKILMTKHSGVGAWRT